MFTSTKLTFTSVNFALDLLRDSFPHLVLSHFLEGVHFLCQPLEAVPNLCPLESKLCLNFSTNLCLSLSDVDERLVAHDFLSLVQLAFELGGNFLFLSGLEVLKALFHFDFEFEGCLFFQEVKIGLMRQPFVAKLCINFGHDSLPCSRFSRLEFEVKAFGPILLTDAVLGFELLS